MIMFLTGMLVGMALSAVVMVVVREIRDRTNWF